MIRYGQQQMSSSTWVISRKSESCTRGHNPGMVTIIHLLAAPNPRVGPLWSFMVRYGPLWSVMVRYGHLWSLMVPHGPLLSCMDPYGLVWFPMVSYCSL